MQIGRYGVDYIGGQYNEVNIYTGADIEDYENVFCYLKFKESSVCSAIPTQHRFYPYKLVPTWVWDTVLVDPASVGLEFGFDFVKAVYLVLEHSGLDFSDKSLYSFECADGDDEEGSYTPDVNLKAIAEYVGGHEND